MIRITNRKDSIERRNHRRMRVRGYVLITNTLKCGPIVDISKGGCAFRYVPDQKKPEVEEELTSGTLIGNDFCLNKVPIEIVSESSINKGIVSIHRCGIRFGELRPGQAKKLKNFLLINILDDVKRSLL